MSQADSVIATLVDRARSAQNAYAQYTQRQVDEVVVAAAWGLMEPARNRELAELAVRDTGLGDVEDKVRKNYRKTLGLLRDLQTAVTVGVISENQQTGITEIARPVGVVAAITPSTNPGATPANKILNALKCGNAIILAPSPKGHSTALRLLQMIHLQMQKTGMSRAMAEGLVQVIPAPVDKARTQALMQQVDLVVATGSQANIRAAYSSGTPAFGVGAGNVSVIIDETADLADAAAKIALSKTFDHATSCSSENSIVVLDSVFDDVILALSKVGGYWLSASDRARLQQTMWPDGKLSQAVIARPASQIARLAKLENSAAHSAKFLMVGETGFGSEHPFSGEKLSPVLAVYRAHDFDEACSIVGRIYAYQGAGHSVGLHSTRRDRADHLGRELPVARVIVNQAHCIATGGSFDNGLPFSLSMGCGTWGGNNFSENLAYKHYLNITRIARPIAERVPSEAEIFGPFFERFGRA
jgi:sulfoacetaldehyde dehydrogenase